MKTLSNYRKWESFVFKGKKWLALFRDDRVHIYDSSFGNYGAFTTLPSFKMMYSREGEALRLV